jgi:hypothetical protein
MLSGMTMLIYALIDPRDGQRRYIGKTMRTAHRRLRRHLARCYLDQADTHKNRWLRQLITLGLAPRIEVLEQCATAYDLAEAERRHIAEHRAAGARLTNLTPGGEGGSGPHTAASREKIRLALTGKKKSEQHRLKIIATITGRKASEQTRAKLRAVHSARPRKPWSEEHRLAIRDGKGGKPFFDQNGNRYESQNGAARDLGLNLGHINEVLKGTRRSTGGYVFTYLRVQEFPA